MIFPHFSGDLFVIVFSMDCRETFEEAIRLREQILETKLNAGATTNSVGLTRKKTLPRVPMVLAGNKCDKEMRYEIEFLQFMALSKIYFMGDWSFIKFSASTSRILLPITFLIS